MYLVNWGAILALAITFAFLSWMVWVIFKYG